MSEPTRAPGAEALAGDEAARAADLIAEAAEVLVVRLGASEFGLPVARVRNVLRVPTITRIPFPPASVLGVASVRGVIVPVIDLGERLLGRPAKRDGRLVLVESETWSQEIALLVDSVSSLLSAHGGATETPQEVEVSLPDGWISGVLAPAPERLVTLLELEPVLDVSAGNDKERE